MKHLILLPFLTAFALAVSALTPPMPIQTENSNSSDATGTCANITPLQLPDGIQSMGDRIIGDRRSPMKVTSRAEAEEWTYFGTIKINDEFINFLQSYFGYQDEETPQVYMRAINNYEWELKLIGFLGTDILMKTNLYSGETSIPAQMTGIPSPYAGQDGYYSNLMISADSLDGTPFGGEIILEEAYMLVADNLGYKLADRGYLTMAFTVTERWQDFGLVSPSEAITNNIRTYIPDFWDAGDKFNVIYLKLTDRIWLFRIIGFANATITLVSYMDERVTVCVNTEIPYSNPYYYEDGYYYSCYHITSYFAGTPRDGQMRFPFWLLITPGYGYNLQQTDNYLTFETPGASSFSLIGANRFAGPDEARVKFDVEHSSNVTRAKVNLRYLSYSPENNSTSYETLVDDYCDITGDAIEINLSKGRGMYVLKALGVDEVGEFGTQKNIYIFSLADGHRWEDMGKGLLKPKSFAYCWPDGHTPWLEVKIEKAADTENLYRIANPFRIPQITDNINENYKFNTDFDFYLYFGDGNDYSILQSYGIVERDEYINYHPVAPAQEDNSTPGIYNLNIGEVTLPGTGNYGIDILSDTSARVAPHSKDVVYCVVPADKAVSLNLGRDSRAWFESKAAVEKHVIPDADGIVNFDDSECKGTVHLIAIATLDENATRRQYDHILAGEGDGLIKVGELEVSQFWTYLSEDPFDETYVSVSINPFDRTLVQIANPFAQLDGRLVSPFYTDFSSPRNIYFATSPGAYVYSSDAGGNVLEIGGKTGVLVQDTEGRLPTEMTPEDILEYSTLYFQTETNTYYRSSMNDKDIDKAVSQGAPAPVRMGSLLVFPRYRAQLYSMLFGLINIHEFFIFAPTDTDRDLSIGTLDSYSHSFAVGHDISSVKALITPAGEYHADLYEILTGNDAGTMLSVADGRTESVSDLPDGNYEYTAVAYDAEDNVANVIKGNVYLTSGLDGIHSDNSDGPAVYYNLQGVEVANPDNGIYIVRRGDKVTKELIRR